MGYAIDALPRGVRNVQRNPMLIAIALGVLVAMIPLLVVAGVVGLVLSFIPVVGQLLTRLVVSVPLKILLLGGMVGAAGAGFAGSVTFGDYLDAVRENFGSLFGTFAIYEVVLGIASFALGIVFFFVFGFGAVLAGGTGDASMASAGLGVGMVALFGVALLFFFAFAVVFQFLDVAVVLGDHDATGAFAESLRLVREAPLSVLGYTVLRAVVFLAVLLPGVVVTAAAEPVADVLLWVGLAVTVLLYPVAIAVTTSYHAAYYGVRLKAG